MVEQHRELNYAGQDIYFSLDVHKWSWVVAIMVKGLFHKVFQQAPDTLLLVKYLQRNFPGARYHGVYEAGYCGFWICDQLREYGVDCIVVNPADVPTTDKEKRNKTNRVDARKLVRSLSNGELTPIYVPERRAREDRSLVRARRSVVSKQTRCKNQIKALLSFYGIFMPEDVDERYWSARYIAYLRQLQLQGESGTLVLQTLLQELGYHRATLLAVTRAIRQLAKQPGYALHVHHLVGIDGISTVTAMILLTELIELARFHSLDRLASYVGLVPGEHSSGEERTITDMTERKNPYLRWILIECAWSAVRKDPVLMQAFVQLTRRMTKNRAIIRIARKLLNRVRFVLKNGQPYVSLASIAVVA
jgi:transposase